jgi:hypothetical protein
MKRYEKNLLNHLQAEASTTNVPLDAIRKGMGEIGFVKGNPLTNTNITLNISITYFTTGAPVVIIPFAALPAILQQTPLGIPFFGLTDFYGGYNSTINLLNINTIPGFANWHIIPSNGLFGGQQNSIGIFVYTLSLIPNIYNSILPSNGDMIFLYIATVAAVNYGALVTIHCDNVSYGTFLNSFVSDLITIDTIRYIVPIANINQFLNPLIFAYQTLFGKIFTDTIDPRMYITNKDFQQQICDIPVNLPIDKAIMILTNIDPACQNFSLMLFVSKVEPLTHK